MRHRAIFHIFCSLLLFRFFFLIFSLNRSNPRQFQKGRWFSMFAKNFIRDMMTFTNFKFHRLDTIHITSQAKQTNRRIYFQHNQHTSTVFELS